MKILVIGGTGTIGGGVIKAFQQDRANQIDVISRSEYESSYENVIHIKGDARDYEFIAGVVTPGKYDAIVDLMIWTEKEFLERMDLFMSNCRHYIATSTSSVYWKSDGMVTEETPRVFDSVDDKELLESHEYRIEKSRIENDIMNSAYHNWTIIRPAMTYGKKLPLCVYTQEVWFYRALHSRTVLLPIEVMNNHAVLTTAEEYGEKLLRVILNERTYSQVLNIISGNKANQITWTDNLRICEDALAQSGYTMKVKYVSVYDMAEYIDHYPLLYDRMMDRIWDDSKFKQLCIGGGGVQFNVYEDLRDRIKNFIQNPSYINFDAYVYHHAYMDKVCGERTQLKEFRSKKARIIYFLARNFSFHGTQKFISLYRRIKNKLKKLFSVV